MSLIVKLFLALLSLLGTGYVLQYSFKAMDAPSDLGYVCGAIAIFLWAALQAVFWKRVFRKKEKQNETSGQDVKPAVNPSDSDGLHN